MRSEGGRLFQVAGPNTAKLCWPVEVQALGKRRVSVLCVVCIMCGWLQNVAPNHRANDVIVLEGRPQTLVGRFMYGPLDVVSLTGEKVCTDLFVHSVM